MFNLDSVFQNTSKSLFGFQDRGINSVVSYLKTDMSVLAVSPTGSGKTVLISTLSHRFIKNTTQDVIILVHRTELLEQTREELYDWYGIVSQKIDADTKIINPGVRVFVSMVETFDRRSSSSSFLGYFKNVGLVIIDECHLANFNKIFMHFPYAKRIGFTATPIFTSKNDPIKNYYKDIVIIATTTELLELNSQFPGQGIVPCDEYSFPSIDRKSLKTKGDDFDEDDMGEKFSGNYQVQNTVEKYILKAFGKRAICFNANIKHSLLVNQAFLDAGIKSRHLDSKLEHIDKKYRGEYRKDCFDWLKGTKGAVLQNVGIATIGNNIKQLECIITNLSTKSMTKFIQMRGRGGRPYFFDDIKEWKKQFIHLDMGDNIVGGNMPRYEDDVDWEYKFRNPKSYTTPGISPVKTCPECGSINIAATRCCKGMVENWFTKEIENCNFFFPASQSIEDTIPRELIRLTKNINVKQTIDYFQSWGEYKSMHETIEQVLNVFRTEILDNNINPQQLAFAIDEVKSKVNEWHKLKDKRKFPDYSKVLKDKTIEGLQKRGFVINIEEYQNLVGNG